jgi:hypothetical protein
MKNYNELRATNVSISRLLVVVVVPPDLGDWTLHSEDELALRRCGYWLSLRGLPPVDNQETRTVHLPRNQKFDVVGLDALFTRLANNELP